MSLPTNTWIEVERVEELHKGYYEVDVTDGYKRGINCVYNFYSKKWITGIASFTPTHFMIIELPNKK